MMGACVAPPTKLFETTPAQGKNPGTAAESQVMGVIRPGSALVDARPDFEYALAHVPGSWSMHWQDFSQKEKPFLGELDLDLFVHARRLARYGIRPLTPVVILGKGLQSSGEDYRLAWTFQVMGIKDVQVLNIKYVSIPKLHGEEPLPSALPIWKPEIDDTLTVSRDVFLVQAMKAKDSERAVIIDCRPEASYLGKDNSAFAQTAPDLGAINIPWQQFFEEDGSVNPTIAGRIEAVGVRKDQKIFVIEEAGVRSAAVTLALRKLGFFKAANFAGGYLELVAAGKR
jgi:thiosulfate/3-mercaptopyruvate sulfurtransferase